MCIIFVKQVHLPYSLFMCRMLNVNTGNENMNCEVNCLLNVQIFFVITTYNNFVSRVFEVDSTSFISLLKVISDHLLLRFYGWFANQCSNHQDHHRAMCSMMSSFHIDHLRFQSYGKPFYYLLGE